MEQGTAPAPLPDRADDQFIYLDEDQPWVLWLPDDSGEAVVVHGHEATDDEEWLFIECEAAVGPDGAPWVRCPDCGATVPEAQIDAWIDALPDAVAEPPVER